MTDRQAAAVPAGLAQLFEENPALREALLTPLHPADQRKATLREIARRVSATPCCGTTLDNW